MQDILRPVDMANLRVAVMIGEDGLDPAIVIICDSIGQIDLGWIEKSNVLSNTLFAPVAPVGWQAAAYKALCGALPAVLPIFGYEDFMEEMSAMYWDGETTDEGASVTANQPAPKAAAGHIRRNTTTAAAIQIVRARARRGTRPSTPGASKNCGSTLRCAGIRFV